MRLSNLPFNAVEVGTETRLLRYPKLANSPTQACLVHRVERRLTAILAASIPSLSEDHERGKRRKPALNAAALVLEHQRGALYQGRYAQLSVSIGFSLAFDDLNKNQIVELQGSRNCGIRGCERQDPTIAQSGTNGLVVESSLG